MNAAKLTTVITPMTMTSSPSQVWRSLMFYEQIDAQPPLLLRLFLPRPLRTEGAKADVGDQATCLYEGGHLLKRVTEIDKHRLYAFTVVEQRLALGRGILLAGGTYELSSIAEDRTELTVTTHYISRQRPRWLTEPVERFVCHMFHRFLLRSIRSKALSMTVDSAYVQQPAK